jgi:hypothetical protein
MTAPTPTFTAPTSATDQLTAAIARTLAAQHGPADRFSIDEATAALLAGGAVREEWGARYHNPDDGNVDTWCGTREEAERMIAARYQGVAPWPHRSSLIRWFVIVTAPEVTQ